MTKPRTNPSRELFGIIGSLPDTSQQRQWWNAQFAEQGIDAFMDHYPTTVRELPERLSEMFHFDRRGYIVGKALQKAVISYLDVVDSSVGQGSVAWLHNDSGVITGYGSVDRAHMMHVWGIGNAG